MAKTATKPETKSLLTPFQVKAVNAEERTFEGLASTWDLDLGGDVIHPGAFKKTLREWKRDGRIVKLFYGHNYYDIDSLLGKMIDAEETKDGLQATFKVTEGEQGDRVLAFIGDGVLDSMSIGYRAVKVEYPDDDEQRQGIFRHLKEVELHEVSVVPFPMNPAARIDTDSIKAIEAGDISPIKTALAHVQDPKNLRVIASHIGHLLRNAPPADAADAQEEEKAGTPEAPPAQSADAQKAIEAAEIERAEMLRSLLLREIERHL